MIEISVIENPGRKI